MPDKVNQLVRECGPWAVTLLLSCWGGAVNYIAKNRKKQFRARDLIFDLIISSFAGSMMHLLCKHAGLSQEVSAVLIAISGHMGTRAIASFEKLRDRFFGGSTEV